MNRYELQKMIMGMLKDAAEHRGNDIKFKFTESTVTVSIRKNHGKFETYEIKIIRKKGAK